MYPLASYSSYAPERWPLIACKSQKNKEYGNLVVGPKTQYPIINFIMATGILSQEYAGRIRKIEETSGGQGRHWHT